MASRTIPNPGPRAATAGAGAAAAPSPAPQSVAASELGGLLARVAPPQRLSLDCFDTILWRRTADPVDVFYELQQHPAFRQRGLAPVLRVRAESQARKLQWARHGSFEVGLAHIYRAAFPGLDDAEVTALAEAELEAEMRACYAFPGAVELLRDAARRRLPVMVVSDTYLSQDQLQRLLAHCLPADALAAIDRIVCSNEHGASKSGGLFRRVLQRWPMAPGAILHVGDNERADLQAAAALGIRAVLVRHADAALSAQERLQAVALGLVEPRVRHERGLARPYHGVLAAAGAQQAPEASIGYATLGQMMHAFARFVLAERQALAAAGGRPKLLFLMRDAHLPALACAALAGGPAGSAVRISRFAAIAASFRSRDDVERYVSQFANPDYFDAMLRQLLLPAGIAERVLARARASRTPAAEFVRQVMRDDVLGTIFDASRRYFAKLRRYLERQAGLEPGDTAVFVDLGYQGSAQRLLEPVFRDEWGVEIAGRYLLCARTPGWERSRRGLIDPSWCDDRAIASLVPYVAVLENLCTSSDRSVVDYTDDGEPVLDEEALIADEQHRRVARIQEEALRFVADAERFLAATGDAEPAALRDAALGALTRLLFFPTREELAQLGSFELDMNLGTAKTFRLHDTEAGLAGLRERGLFFMEENLDSMRLLRPAELHAAGMELSLTLLAHHRFGLEIGVAESSTRREPLRVLLMRGEQAAQQQIQALHTHDGWYALHLPLGLGDLHAGVAFGERYRYVQIHCVKTIPVTELYGDRESEHGRDVLAELQFDGMEPRGEGLYECTDPTSLMIVPPCKDPAGRRLAARVVFRPIVPRQPES